MKNRKRAKGNRVERKKEDWSGAVSVGRAGFTGCGRAVFAKPVSGPGHYSHGASRISTDTAGELHCEEAIGSGEGSLRDDWAPVSDWNSDGAATKSAGGGAGAGSGCHRGYGNALLEADDR